MTMAAESGSDFRNFMKVEKNCEEEGSSCAAEGFVVVCVLCFCWFAGSFSRNSLFFAIASPFWLRLCCAAKATMLRTSNPAGCKIVIWLRCKLGFKERFSASKVVFGPEVGFLQLTVAVCCSSM